MVGFRGKKGLERQGGALIRTGCHIFLAIILKTTKSEKEMGRGVPKMGG
jgi:hypothetical protein